MLRLQTHSLTQILISLSNLYKATVTIIAFRTNKVIKNVFTISDTYSNPSKNYVLIVVKFWGFGGVFLIDIGVLRHYITMKINFGCIALPHQWQEEIN